MSVLLVIVGIVLVREATHGRDTVVQGSPLVPDAFCDPGAISLSPDSSARGRHRSTSQMRTVRAQSHWLTCLRLHLSRG